MQNMKEGEGRRGCEREEEIEGGGERREREGESQRERLSEGCRKRKKER